jgi:hypothetical protein
LRRRAFAFLLVCSFLAAQSASATVERGRITPNRGAKGITLGMTRAQVVGRLGQPLFQNQNGYMEYSRNNLFDVYVDVSPTPKRVRLIGISGPNFCFGGGVCMFARGAVGELKDRYGSALKVVRLESGERVYRLTGMYRGCEVFTDFSPERLRRSARIIMTFIGFLNFDAC